MRFAAISHAEALDCIKESPVIYTYLSNIGVGLVVIRKVTFVYFLIDFNCSQVFFYGKLKSVIIRYRRTVFDLPAAPDGGKAAPRL